MSWCLSVAQIFEECFGLKNKIKQNTSKEASQGKGKTKALKEPSNLPEELAGLSSWTKTGKRRC